MSVINKMLKDIEQREVTAQLPIEPTVEVANIVDIQQWIKVGLFGALLLGSIILAYLFIPNKLSVSNEVSNTPQSVAQLTPSVTAESMVEAQAEVPATLTSLPIEGERESPAVDLVERSSKQTEPVSPEPSVSSQRFAAAAVDEKQQMNNTVVQSSPLAQPASARIQVTRLTTRERAEEWFTQGKESFKFGLVDDAIRDLDKSLTLMPMHIDARSLLAAAYYGRGQLAQADAILRHGLSLNPDVMRWRILLAKILVERQSYESVLSILSPSYDAHANIDYWILKGTAAQQLNENSIALSSFRKLTQLQPDQAKWWLALASSSDAAGEQSNARRFYMTALELGGLSPNSRSHAEKRLEYLGGQL